jgi:hypothetical protein
MTPLGLRGPVLKRSLLLPLPNSALRTVSYLRTMVKLTFVLAELALPYFWYRGLVFVAN